MCHETTKLEWQLRAAFLRKPPEAMGDRNEDGSVPYWRNHWCHQLQPHCLELGLQDSPSHFPENAFFPPRRQQTTARSLEGCLAVLFSVLLLATNLSAAFLIVKQWGALIPLPYLPLRWKCLPPDLNESSYSMISYFIFWSTKSLFFFPFKTLFLTSFHSPNQKLWRICKRPEILSYLQAKRLVCHNCKDPIRRHKTPRSYIKDFIFNGTECSQVS